MARIGALFFALVGLLLVTVNGAAVPEAGSLPIPIGTIINLIGLGLVTKINAFITLESLEDNLISINFDVKNPLPIELTIDRVVSSAGINGTVFATFDHTFATPVVVPILGTKNSGTIDNVLLTQGATASLDIIPLGVLDLISTDVFIRAGTIFGKLGVPIPITGLKQKAVPTNYTLLLS
ncbi:hypothetical protein BDQ12DRAFT_710429 [Crucibulum laeve]|uniref:Late embryogenesis abundant protein LEA-2 subgroup domain-containing protein n=1 Tax=Crucibulum laeve TaxID=68775 RepID=A0A5C3MBW1_9AGAR|nr:hypothetical protein BDQ12DRAFT_710429 [Crucibulum laeve]